MMTIRNKLLILLLCISLIPLIAYFILDISFKQIVMDRIQKTLRLVIEERAKDTIIEAVDHYEEKLRIYSQAVRYGLHHYAEQIQRDFWDIDSNIQPSTNRSLSWLRTQDFSKESYKYRFINSKNNQVPEVDFDSQFLFTGQNESQNSLSSRLSHLTSTCKDIYSINPESKLWIYTILEDGTVGLYPSVGFWPYPQEYDFRQEAWYLNVKTSKQLIPEPRIEPLTGKSVMTVAMPLFGQDNSFVGIVAMDLDLSGMLESIRIPRQWHEGAWKFIVREPDIEDTRADEINVICATSFSQNQNVSIKSPTLSDLCDSKHIKELLDGSRLGRISTMYTSYNNSEYLWCYGSSVGRGGFPVIAVPYQRITEQVNNTQQLLFQDNIRAIQLATIMMFIVILAVVVLAVLRARHTTKPITDLTNAAEKLAQGDFEVKVEIRTNDEFQKLGKIFNQTGPKLKTMEKMKRSLELARAIQQNLLPKTPPIIDSFELAGRCKYCDETGGDFYDFIELTDMSTDHIGIALGDVTGHGIGAALLMAAARSILRSHAQLYRTSLTQLFDVLNKQLVDDTDYDKFITLFYGVLDIGQKSLTWASGGHDPALWYHNNSGKIEELPNTGMPLGIMENTCFEQKEPILLRTGDVIVIGTDGIWEAQNGNGIMFGKEKYYEIVSRYGDRSANEICSEVINEIIRFSIPAPQLDDITLIVIKAL